MKPASKSIVLTAVIIFLMSGLLLYGCHQKFTLAQSVPTPAPSYILDADHSPTSEGKEAPDAIIFTPGGLGYIANLHQEGQVSNWPSIPVSAVVLGGRIDNILVGYRANIETKVGQVRNNIVNINKHWLIPLPWIRTDIKNINLKVANLPGNFQVWQDLEWHGPPGWAEKILFIEIPEQTKTGEYVFEIGIEVDGKDYGRVPCTIKVVE